MKPGWYGESMNFRVLLEAEARRRYGRHLTVRLNGALPEVGFAGSLVYNLDELDVRGRVLPIPVQVTFRPTLRPKYASAIEPQDYPRVVAEPDARSPHRVEGRALCLYYPWDPKEDRWHAALGLAALFDLTAQHLLFEHLWRENGNVWLGREAPHETPIR